MGDGTDQEAAEKSPFVSDITCKPSVVRGARIATGTCLGIEEGVGNLLAHTLSRQQFFFLLGKGSGVPSLVLCWSFDQSEGQGN